MTEEQPQTAAEPSGAGSVPGANFGPYAPYAPALLARDTTAAPATLLALLAELRESATTIDPRDPRLAALWLRVERAQRSGAGQSTMGRRVLSILDGAGEAEPVQSDTPAPRRPTLVEMIDRYARTYHRWAKQPTNAELDAERKELYAQIIDLTHDIGVQLHAHILTCHAAELRAIDAINRVLTAQPAEQDEAPR